MLRAGVPLQAMNACLTIGAGMPVSVAVRVSAGSVVPGPASQISLFVMAGGVIRAVIGWELRDRGTNADDSRLPDRPKSCTAWRP